MTIDEAKKIAYMASFVDGGCPVCVRGLMTYLIAAFPEFEWTNPESKYVRDEAIQDAREDLAGMKSKARYAITVTERS